MVFYFFLYLVNAFGNLQNTNMKTRKLCKLKMICFVYVFLLYKLAYSIVNINLYYINLNYSSSRKYYVPYQLQLLASKGVHLQIETLFMLICS
jgi:hypothetical protein